jgi:hypothetical protein
MEVYNTKGVIIMCPLAVFAIMLMIFLNGYGCAAAAVLVKTNTTFRCDDRLDECLVQDDLQLEFLMNPYVSRVLTGAQPPPSHGQDAVQKPTKPVFNPCSGSSPPAYCTKNPGKENKRKCNPKDNLYRCRN